MKSRIAIEMKTRMMHRPGRPDGITIAETANVRGFQEELTRQVHCY